ncbi:MAG TPA: FGGY family carbohydrate kinase [Acidimicrobiales bacterium]|jgi:glycerol kinase|nr:FGGY family carbohydrate kinase [Acidimicrobiales bacterium]
MTESVLVLDVGTSSVRASLVEPDGAVRATRQVPVLPASPAPGVVEVDADAIAEGVLATAAAVLDQAGDVAGVAVTNQRATTVVWDAASGRPVGPGIGWQDLRTVIDCLTLQSEGVRVAPNASATKLRWLVQHADPALVAGGSLRFGTIDTWVASVLSNGELHLTDASNAGVTGLVTADGAGWDPDVLAALGLDPSLLPTIVDTCGELGAASALRGAPTLCALVGDQQASLAGQGCVDPGQGKLTFGTGGMLDQVSGARPTFASRGTAGCFPIVARQRHGQKTWGVEAVMLTAGGCIEWLRDDLELVATAAETDALAASVLDTAGVSFVPALLGIGTPEWDFGARGGFFGLTRGATRAHLARAVLAGIAERGRDLIEAAERDALAMAALRVDGGMSANATFVQLLADATGRPVEVAPVLEATTRGAGLLGCLGIGLLDDEASIAATWRPSRTVDPVVDDATRDDDRERWLRAKAQALRTIPSLSDVSFT